MATRTRKGTRHKGTQEALRQREKRFRALIEHSWEVILLSDVQGSYSYASPSIERVLGYTPEEFVHLNGFTLIHPDDLPAIAQTFQTLLATPGFSDTQQFRGKHKNGSWRWVEATATNLLDEPGVGAIVTNFHDITDHKQVEQNLLFLAEASKVLASSLDYHSTLMHVANLAVPHIADWCVIEMLDDKGQPQSVAVSHKDPKKVEWAKELRKSMPPHITENTGIGAVIQTKKSGYYPLVTDEMLVAAARNEQELEHLRKLGMRSVMIVPLIVQDTVIGTISFVADESGKQFSPADLSMAEEVATRAALAIENARLYTEAQKAIALRDDFISIASHELKTPITSLKMYTQVLQKQFAKKGEESLARFLAKMDTQLNKLTVLIRDLLNVSKIELGQLEFREEAFDVNEVVKDTVEQIQSTTTQLAIHIEGRITQPVWGDKDRIGQVLTNLLTNAIKYSPEAETVLVRLTPDSGVAVVTVQDFGIGIAKEHQRSIFTRFYRVSDPEEQTYPGLGIGLYVSNEIIKRHGGTLTVSSEKGKGSQFRFTLPYARSTVKSCDILSRKQVG